MAIVSFTVPCIPVGQPRARAVTFAGKARMYGAAKSHPIHVFKAAVAQSFQSVHDGAPSEGPVSIVLQFVLPRPKCKRWKSKPMQREHHTSKPDIDNLVKGACDALTGLAWVDDAQLCSVVGTKWIASGDEQPHVRVSISGDYTPTNPARQG